MMAASASASSSNMSCRAQPAASIWAIPVDGGISLEYEEPARSGSTPRPTYHGEEATEPDDSASEFELSLDDSSGEMPAAQDQPVDSEFEMGAASDSSTENPTLEPDNSASEFELSLDDSSGDMSTQGGTDDSEFEIGAASDSSTENQPLADESSQADSESEFELSLDDSNADVSTAGSFDSDFDVGAPSDSSTENPSLDDDSGSEFELSMSGSDESLEMESAAPDDDSGSDSEFDLTLDDSGSPPPPATTRKRPRTIRKSRPTRTSSRPTSRFLASTRSPDRRKGPSTATPIWKAPTSTSRTRAAARSWPSTMADFEDEEDQPPPPKRGKGKQPAPPPKRGAQQRPTRSRPAPAQEEEEYPQDDFEPEQEQEDIGSQDAFDDLAADAGQFPDPQAGPSQVVVEERVQYVRPAPWGVIPTIFMFPCLLVMIAIGLLAFEQIQNTPGYGKKGMFTKLVEEHVKPLIPF